MASVTGTFADTGQSGVVAGTKITIKMNFAGTASVDIEEQMPDGDWIKIETAITADARYVFDSPTLSAVRLNCTAHTNDVEYLLESN